MTTGFTQRLEQYLIQKREEGLYRSRILPTTDRSFLDFSCNDYLSLTHDPRIKQAYRKGFDLYPSGSGGSMVLSGYHPIHRQLEQAFAESLQVDDCLLYSSGYVANLSVVSLLTQFDAHIVIDKAVHASIYDGLTLSGASFSRFHHNQASDLQQKLQNQKKNSVVITESIFSMSGEQASLCEISDISKQNNAYCIVDEAHGFGVLGFQGLGGVVNAKLTQEEIPLRVIPFGKALGACGAIVAGKRAWIDALLQSTKQPVYSTAISPGYTYGILETFQFLREAEDRRAHLRALISYFRDATTISALKWRDSYTPIQQLQLGCPFQAVKMTEKLHLHGIRCFPIRQPTVSKQETGLRVILNYDHTFRDIDNLLRVLAL